MSRTGVRRAGSATADAVTVTGDGSGVDPITATVGSALHTFGLSDTYAPEYADCLGWRCPTCGVPPESLCLTNQGHVVPRPHAPRVRTARRWRS